MDRPEETKMPGSTTSASTLKWMPRLFAKLQARYGNRWSSQWPTEEMREAAIREWSEVLRDVDPHKIKAFLDHYNSEWPPCAAEIRAVCKPATHAAHQPYKALPKPKRSRDEMAGYFADLKAAIRRDEYLPRDAA